MAASTQAAPTVTPKRIALVPTPFQPLGDERLERIHRAVIDYFMAAGWDAAPARQCAGKMIEKALDGGRAELTSDRLLRQVLSDAAERITDTPMPRAARPVRQTPMAEAIPATRLCFLSWSWWVGRRSGTPEIA